MKKATSDLENLLFIISIEFSVSTSTLRIRILYINTNDKRSVKLINCSRHSENTVIYLRATAVKAKLPKISSRNQIIIVDGDDDPDMTPVEH